VNEKTTEYVKKRVFFWDEKLNRNMRKGWNLSFFPFLFFRITESSVVKQRMNKIS
jgi:hypothetical protein